MPHNLLLLLQYSDNNDSNSSVDNTTNPSKSNEALPTNKSRKKDFAKGEGAVRGRPRVRRSEWPDFVRNDPQVRDLCPSGTKFCCVPCSNSVDGNTNPIVEARHPFLLGNWETHKTSKSHQRAVCVLEAEEKAREKRNTKNRKNNLPEEKRKAQAILHGLWPKKTKAATNDACVDAEASSVDDLPDGAEVVDLSNVKEV